MIALDASAVICLVQRIEPARARLNALVAEHGDRAIVSAAAIAECLVRPVVDRDQPLTAEFEAFFGAKGLRVVPVTASIARQAATLAGRFRLKPLDAIHLATAIDIAADAFATTDLKDFADCVGHVPLAIELIFRYPHQQSPPP